MEEQLLFDETPAPPKKPVRHFARDSSGKFYRGPSPSTAEIATIDRAEFFSPIREYEYPNLSTIVRTRSNGQGIGFYDTMEGTDADLAAFVRDLLDDVLHYPYTIKPASNSTEHKEHARFFQFALQSIPNRQNVIRHFLTAYARGFSVTEKMLRVVDRGEWRGAVIYDALLDKPQRWFTFDMERRLRFRTSENFTPGELVDAGKFIVVTFGSNSNPYGEALFDLCYWPWFLKHHALKNQAIFMDKWATPTAKAEYDWSNNAKLNEENRTKALLVLQAIQNDSSIAIPKGMTIGLLESMRNGTVSFEGYINQLTEMLSRIVTGQILTSMGGDGGSHALGKVHEKRAANKVEMLAEFVSHVISRFIGRDLIDRNYGPQDSYPVLRIIAKSPLSRQADAELEKALMSNGHKVSRSWSDEAFQVVPPTDAADTLEFPLDIQPAQTLPVNSQLAAPVVALASAEHKTLHEKARAAGSRALEDHAAIGAAAAKQARPGITKAVKTLSRAVAKKKRARDTSKADVYRGLKGADVSGLGQAMHTMFRPSPPVQTVASHLAESGPGDPPEISDSAKLALALLMVAMAERIAQAAKDAPEDLDGPTAADSMFDPSGVAVDAAYQNLFEGTHSTNIASIATAKLRARLADPKFRAAHPYVMIVCPNPEARLAHRMLDGYIMTAEEARFSSSLPPFDFGCLCKAIPISLAEARAAGLTGAAPAGDLEAFLRSKGAMPNSTGGYETPGGVSFFPGISPGFAPAYRGTDTGVQLAALRTKAEELRREDPEAWAALRLWLTWLFLKDILTEDPAPEPAEVEDAS